MPLRSDVWINAPQFDPKAVPKAAAELTADLALLGKEGPRWWEVGPVKFREMRWNNETPIPRPPVIESGINLTFPSRDEGRAIPVRMFKPASGESKGIMLHFHGGGWVLQSEHYQDSYLKFAADEMGLTTISVGYRLAPEEPYPAAVNDCIDAAEHLFSNGRSFGGRLLFIGGDSAGAHLTMLTFLRLLQTRDEVLPIKGLILYYGVFDLSQFLPAVHHYEKTVIIDQDIMTRYVEAFLPDTTIEQRRDPQISPFFANLHKFRGRLPPALMLCGTDDPLLDDTIMMSVKYQAAGAEAVVRVYPGAPHGFMQLPERACESAGLGRQVTKEFVVENLKVE